MTNMRLFVATLALLASASAYAPSQRSARRPTRMAAEVVDRRAALSAAVSGAVALGALGALAPAARADGAVSKATVSRARGIYGAKITALAGAAKAGDLKAFEAERGAFDIFSSSGYARSTLAELWERKEAVKARRIAFHVVRGAKKFVFGVGNAAWITGTTMLVMVMPLVFEIDREEQMAAQMGGVEGMRL